MPNTPAMVGEGMTALCVNELITEEETALAVKLCDTFGKTEVIPEHLMDAVVGVQAALRRMCSCSLRQWQMQQLQMECREHRHTNSPHSPYSEVRN